MDSCEGDQSTTESSCINVIPCSVTSGDNEYRSTEATIDFCTQSISPELSSCTENAAGPLLESSSLEDSCSTREHEATPLLDLRQKSSGDGNAPLFRFDGMQSTTEFSFGIETTPSTCVGNDCHSTMDNVVFSKSSSSTKVCAVRKSSSVGELKEAMDTLESTPCPSQRSLVLEEIVSTEKSYLRDLRILQFVFIDTFHCLFPVDSDVIQGFAPNELDILRHIFVEVQHIFSANLSLYRRMVEAGNNKDSLLGEVLETAAKSFLAVYSPFCSQLEDVLEFLKREPSKNPAFRDYFERTKSSSDSCLDLTDYIMKPFQRILKYSLLIRELLKNTSTQHPDYASLERAAAAWSHATSMVNEVKYYSDSIKKIIKLQESIVGLKHFDLVAPNRKFVMEGYLRKVSHGHAQRRRCFLFSDLFMYCKDTLSGRMLLCDAVHLDELKIANVDDTPEYSNAFQLTRSDKATSTKLFERHRPVRSAAQYLLCCSNPGEKEWWLRNIMEQKTLLESGLITPMPRLRPVMPQCGGTRTLTNFLKRTSSTPIFGRNMEEDVSASKGIHCAACGQTRHLRQCQGCSTIFYCNKFCQARDWNRHKSECSFCKKTTCRREMEEASPDLPRQHIDSVAGKGQDVNKKPLYHSGAVSSTSAESSLMFPSVKAEVSPAIEGKERPVSENGNCVGSRATKSISRSRLPESRVKRRTSSLAARMLSQTPVFAETELLDWAQNALHSASTIRRSCKSQFNELRNKYMKTDLIFELGHLAAEFDSWAETMERSWEVLAVNLAHSMPSDESTVNSEVPGSTLKMANEPDDHSVQVFDEPSSEEDDSYPEAPFDDTDSLISAVTTSITTLEEKPISDSRNKISHDSKMSINDRMCETLTRSCPIRDDSVGFVTETEGIESSSETSKMELVVSEATSSEFPNELTIPKCAVSVPGSTAIQTVFAFQMVLECLFGTIR